jgi:hypothetical protein
MSNPFACKSFLDHSMAQIMNSVNISLMTFFSSQNEVNYNNLINKLNAAQDAIVNSDMSGNLGGSTRTQYKLRYLITLDDGTVVADSSKSNNTFANFKDKKINENHHSRPEMILAMFSPSGVGYSNRYSSSVNAKLLYLANRVGISVHENMGAVRLSVVG